MLTSAVLRFIGTALAVLIASRAADNDPVLSFSDQSGNGRHAAQHTGTPRLKLNVVGTFRGVLFNSVSDLLTGSFLDSSYDGAITVIAYANATITNDDATLNVYAAANSTNLYCGRYSAHTRFNIKPAGTNTPCMAGAR